MRKIRVVAALVFSLFAAAFPASGQSRAGTITGTISDANNSVLRSVNVTLTRRLTGYRSDTTTDASGAFAFYNLPFAEYELTVHAVGFDPHHARILVSSNIPMRRDVSLAVRGQLVSLTVPALNDSDLTQTQTQLSSERLRNFPIATRSNAIQKVVATTSGISTQNNALMHVRGVEDGMLYVVDGVPLTDRIDIASSSGEDIGNVRSVQIITGNFPAEFGGRSGAIAVVQARSGLGEPFTGEFGADLGNFRSNDFAGNIARGWGKRFGLFGNAAFLRSDRYLDPVVEDNFHNHADRHNVNFRADWQPRTTDSLFFDFGLNRTNLQVPNDDIQQEAGQDQRQRFRDDNESVSWQHVFNEKVVSNVIFFRRAATSRLFPSEFGTPLTATQARRQTRSGVLGSVSFFKRGHDLKAGFEATRISLREYFSFAVTDDELAEEREISDEAREFTPANPFVFEDARIGGYIAAYFQDHFTYRNLSVSAGIRFDHSGLPAGESRWSPRVGIAYRVNRTKTVLRASFNRLFQPPQVENLLLSDSDQARALSPFAKDGTGGERVRAERVSAYEVGATQAIRNIARLDAAVWHRNFRNFGDPNTFFNTTIIFPNSVAKGFSRGTDLRLDILERRGFSAYASWTNARILQTGPINGGLFLTDEFIEIGPGTEFIPDHDQRNVVTFGMIYNNPDRRWFAAFGGRHESGVPLEVDEDRLIFLMNTPGADLVDFDRGRMRPWTVFNAQAGIRLVSTDKHTVHLAVDAENIFDRRFAYNFGSPFEGTHFGHPRLVRASVTYSFR